VERFDSAVYGYFAKEIVEACFPADVLSRQLLSVCETAIASWPVSCHWWWPLCSSSGWSRLSAAIVHWERLAFS
jgi:hypothetical protein